MHNPDENSAPLHTDVQDKAITSANNEPLHELVTTAVAYTRQAMPRFLQNLRTLCLTESPSDDKDGLDAMAEHLALLLQGVGMETTLVEHPRGNAILGILTGDNPSSPACLLIGHHDTVHPVGVAHARTRLTEERFYSPGTVDMKAGLLQGIYALEVLNRQNYRDFSTLLFLSVPDEEITSRYHVEWIREVARNYRPLVIGLEGAGSVGNVVIRRKGCIQYRLTAEGRAAHAGSSPERGRNAVLELAHQIVQAQSLMGWREGLTINAGPITGGSRPNIVSDFAEIIFDVRFLRTEDRVDAEAHWQTLLQQQLVPDVALTLRPEPNSMRPMMATEQSLAMARQVQIIAERILKTSFNPETRGGGSDCCNTADEGCPSIDGLGSIGGGAHTADEYALLAPIPDRVGLLTGLIAAITSPSA